MFFFYNWIENSNPNIYWQLTADREQHSQMHSSPISSVNLCLIFTHILYRHIISVNLMIYALWLPGFTQFSGNFFNGQNENFAFLDVYSLAKANGLLSVAAVYFIRTHGWSESGKKSVSNRCPVLRTTFYSHFQIDFKSCLRPHHPISLHPWYHSPASLNFQPDKTWREQNKRAKLR